MAEGGGAILEVEKERKISFLYGVYPSFSTTILHLKADGQTDTHARTHTDGLSKTTFLDVLMVAHPKSGLISNSIFCTMPTFLWDTEVKFSVERVLFKCSSFIFFPLRNEIPKQLSLEGNYALSHQLGQKNTYLLKVVFSTESLSEHSNNYLVLNAKKSLRMLKT